MLTMHVASACVYFKRRQVVSPFPNKGKEMGSRCVKDKKRKNCNIKLFLQRKTDVKMNLYRLQLFLRDDMADITYKGPNYPGTDVPLHPVKKNTGTEPGYIN